MACLNKPLQAYKLDIVEWNRIVLR